MKWFYFTSICLSLLFTPFVYSSGSCEEALSVLINDNANLVESVKKNLRSHHVTKRLQGLRSLREINPDGIHTYLEIIPFLKDGHPQVRMETAQIFEQHNSVHIDIMYALHQQLQRERDSYVAQAIDSALRTIHRRHLEQITNMGKKINKHLRILNFSIKKADHLVKKLEINYRDWLEMTQNARMTKPETRTVMDELALEIYNEISAVEDDFRDMIRTLPFNNSSEFFKFFVHYQKWTGRKTEMHIQTYLIIKMIYLSI